MSKDESYLDWVKHNYQTAFPSLRDESYNKDKSFRRILFWKISIPHVHRTIFISDRCAGTVTLCTKCGVLTVENWSTEEIEIIGYVDLNEAFEITPLGSLPIVVKMLPNGEIEKLWISLNMGRWQNNKTYEIIDGYKNPFEVDPNIRRRSKELKQELNT